MIYYFFKKLYTNLLKIIKFIKILENTGKIKQIIYKYQTL